MRMTTPYPAIASSSLPEGVTLLPRKPEDTKFDEVPLVWHGHSPVLSIGGTIFSFIIPEHEKFFIESVHDYLDTVEDKEQVALIKAFITQESIHANTHEAFNQSRRRYGMNVDRDLGLIKQEFDKARKRWSIKTRLGMTAFMEHNTACSSHIALGETSDLRFQHPTMQELWKWHAVEEIEHKAVAYDLFKQSGGGYFSRIFSAIVTVILDAKIITRLAKNAQEDAKTFWDNGTYSMPELTREEEAFRDEALGVARANNKKMIRSIFKYFLPFFHPWKINDSAYLKKAYPNYGKEV